MTVRETTGSSFLSVTVNATQQLDSELILRGEAEEEQRGTERRRRRSRGEAEEN